MSRQYVRMLDSRRAIKCTVRVIFVTGVTCRNVSVFVMVMLGTSRGVRRKGFCIRILLYTSIYNH